MAESQYPENNGDTQKGNDLNFLQQKSFSLYLAMVTGKPIEDDYVPTREDYDFVIGYLESQKKRIIEYLPENAVEQ